MAILASLGTINFTIAQNDFTKFNNSRRYKYAEFPRLEGKPTLQSVGGELDTPQFRLRLHVQNGDPEADLNALIEAAEEKKPLEFIFGSTYQGNYVINSIREEVKKASVIGDDAAFDWIDVRVSLVEWVGEIIEEETTFSGFPYSEPFA